MNEFLELFEGGKVAYISRDFRIFKVMILVHW